MCGSRCFQVLSGAFRAVWGVLYGPALIIIHTEEGTEHGGNGQRGNTRRRRRATSPESAGRRDRVYQSPYSQERGRGRGRHDHPAPGVGGRGHHTKGDHPFQAHTPSPLAVWPTRPRPRSQAWASQTSEPVLWTCLNCLSRERALSASAVLAR